MNKNKDLVIYNIIKLLDDGYSFMPINDNKELHFYEEFNKIIIISIDYKLKITKEDFINLYKDYKFILETKDEESEIDTGKDKEYYSKIQNKQ